MKLREAFPTLLHLRFKVRYHRGRILRQKFERRT